MEIFWIENKERRGPLSVADTISRIQLGEINAQTKGWHKGCAQWDTLDALPALRDFFTPPAASATAITENTTITHLGNPDQSFQGAVSGEQIHDLPNISQAEMEGVANELMEKIASQASPFHRLIARLVDLSLYAALYMAVIYLLKLPFNLQLLISNPLIWMPLILIESIMLSIWGRTPGKALMGMKLVSLNNAPLSFGRCINRSMFVFIGGLGMMLFVPPLCLTLLAMAVSYWMVTKRGISPWDMRASTVFSQKKPTSFMRSLLAIPIIFYALSMHGYFMMPWTPALLSQLEEVDPEAAAKFESMLPPEILEEFKEKEQKAAEDKK